MRTLLTIAIITLLLFGGSFTSHRFIQTTTEIIGNQLNTVEQSLSDRKWELAKKELTTAQQSWEMSNLWWTILIEHQEIDTINISMKRLEKYIEAQDLPQSMVEVTTLKLRVENIYESIRLSVKNLF